MIRHENDKTLPDAAPNVTSKRCGAKCYRHCLTISQAFSLNWSHQSNLTQKWQPLLSNTHCWNQCNELFPGRVVVPIQAGEAHTPPHVWDLRYFNIFVSYFNWLYLSLIIYSYDTVLKRCIAPLLSSDNSISLTPPQIQTIHSNPVVVFLSTCGYRANRIYWLLINWLVMMQI